MMQFVFTIKKSLILLLSVIAFSCCQQEDDYVKFAKSETSQRYLTVEPGFLANNEVCYPDSNYTNLYEAFERFIEYKKYQIYPKTSFAKKANISADLFCYLNSINNTSSTTRTANQSNNDKSDCTACTIAAIYSEMLENTNLEKPIYNAAWKYATFSQAFGKSAKKQERKVIPMVNFVPSDFIDHVKQQFAYSPNRASFIILGKKSFIHYNSQGKGFVDKELKFDELCNFASKHDSTFIFSLSSNTPAKALDGQHYWGYVKNDKLYFYDFLNKNTYSSLQELIIAQHGSIDKFMSFYQNNVLNCMKSLSPSNELYVITDENEAKDILRKDFSFPYIENPMDSLEEIEDRVISLLSTRLVLTKKTKELLKSAITFSVKPDITDATALAFNKEAFTSVFSPNELKIIEEVLAVRRLKVGKAYLYLKDKLLQEKKVDAFASEEYFIREIRKSL